jgi:hypothetical protein
MSAVQMAGGRVVMSGGGVAVTASGGGFGAFDGTVKIAGNKFVNGAGQQLFMRGANYSGYELAAINGFGNPDCSGAQAGQAHGPKISKMVNPWKMSVCRIPLNMASWLGHTVYSINAQTINPDPSGQYQAQVVTQVNALTAAGLYVALDLHWSQPGYGAPLAQSEMCDGDRSLDFWTSVANTFGYPNGSAANRAVMFEGYNEPIIYSWPLVMQGGTLSTYKGNGNGPNYQVQVSPFPVTVNSGTFVGPEAFTGSNGTNGLITHYYPPNSTLHCYVNFGNTLGPLPVGTVITGVTSGATATVTGASSWTVAGHQQILNTIRATGATNVYLASGLNYSSLLDQWAANVPTDPTPAGYGAGWVSQIGAVWHCYPAASPTYGNTGYGLPNYGSASYTYAQNILGSGYPVIITENGGKTGAGGATGASEPFISNVCAWCDTYSVSMIGWAWDTWGNGDDVMITDVNGTPTQGQGQVQYNWMSAHP